MATNGTARDVIMRPPPKQLPPPKTVTIAGEDFPAMTIDGNPYAKVNQRVEAAHTKGGYSVVSAEAKVIAGVECYEVWIELPNGQRFPGTAEINKGIQKPIAKAQTRAIGRALAFAGFNIETSIASGEEMEDVIEGRGETIVDANNGRQEKPLQTLIRHANHAGLKNKELVDSFEQWAGKSWNDLNRSIDEEDFRAVSEGLSEWIDKHSS